jgi:antitoxin component of MazEF toxin-antitoxin module
MIPSQRAVEFLIAPSETGEIYLFDRQINCRFSQEEPQYQLNELLSDVAIDSVHFETDWGMPVGMETL